MRVLLIVFILCCYTLVTAQKIYDDRDPTVSFGLQVGAIFPTDLLNIRSATVIKDDKLYGLEPINGFSFGGVVNFRMSKSFYILSGISFLRRDYVAFEVDGSIRRDVRFRSDTYEIPIMASYYLRLSDNLLLNISSGIPLHFLPTDLAATNDGLDALSLKLGVIKPVSSTMVGMEWRKPNYGGIYLGAVYNIAPWSLFVTSIGERDTPFEDSAFVEQVGDFFGIVMRYYLP